MKELRLYVAVQDDCEACKTTLDVLGVTDNPDPIIADVPIYVVYLGSDAMYHRRKKMGATTTPAIFLVEAEDKDGDNIADQSEETHIYHQNGMIADKGNLVAIIKAYKEGKIIRTKL